MGNGKGQFFDPKLNGLDWDSVRERYRKEAEYASSRGAFSGVINRMLSELRTSHTHYYVPEEPEYYQIAGIFWSVLSDKLKPFLAHGAPRYAGIGITTAQLDGRIFVRTILDGSPAARGGLRVGDQILEVDNKPFDPVRSFTGKIDHLVKVRVQRTSDLTSVVDLPVKPMLLDPTTMYLEAMKASAQIIDKDGEKIGYIHIWSYAGEVYQDQLEDELNGRLSEVDGLVLDLRDGWGGANTDYLNFFIAPPLRMTVIGRDGKHRDEEESWTKPMCLLVNEGTKSGKELLSYYFRKAKRGLIIGSRTAGAVMAGRVFVMQDGSLLYLAVKDILVDGKRLESHGLIPDIEVPFQIEYAQGADSQKMAAIGAIAKAARAPNH